MAEVPVAVVTGARRGLGLSVLRRLVASGYDVAACALGEPAPDAGESMYRRLDVTEIDQVDRFVDEVLSRWTHVDLLVNNAGFANGPTDLAETDIATARRCFATNVLGPYAFMHRILPVMFRQATGGVIVNVASRAGLVPVPQLAAYSASKSALIALTLAAGKELEGGRVLCVSICPAGMKTEMREKVYGTADAAGQMDPERATEVILEIAARRSVGGVPVESGAAVEVSNDRGAQLVQWRVDARGFRGIPLS